MKLRLTAMLAVVALLAGVIPALAQVQTGEITGRVSDDTGAVLPGATVTLTSPVLIQPQTATSSEAGSYRFTGIPIGTYAVKFELPGFKTVMREGILVNIGFTAQVNQQLVISTVQETVTVSGESPIVDTKTNTEQDDVRSRDPAEHAVCARPVGHVRARPGITMDRATSAAPVRATVRLRQHVGATPATTSGRSTAWTSRTCPPPAPRRSTTTSTCCRRCRSRRAARTRRSRPEASASTSSRAPGPIASRIRPVLPH